MNAREATKINESVENRSHLGGAKSAYIYREAKGYLSAVKKAEPVVEELEKMRAALSFAFSQLDQIDYPQWSEEQEKQMNDALSSSAEVLDKYKKECLGE